MKTLKIIFVSLVIILTNNFSIKGQLPQTYDLRTLGLMSAVKDQGSCGACWAFATIASIESNWLKNGYGPYILSEDNLTDCHGFDETPCVGGSFYMSQALLSRHGGPLKVSDDPYTPTVSDCPNNLPYPPIPPAYVEEIRFLPNDIDKTKQAIYDYGAVATAMFFNPANYNSSTFKYYDNAISSADSLYPHCVTLAGWNDNMSFPGAPGNGGWIIKDSYGTSWADNGYFYVSYYDAGILSETAYFPSFKHNSNGLANTFAYLYDELGWVDNFGLGNNTGYALVHYTLIPQSGTIIGQKIKRVGTYAVEDNTTINIEIYREFNSGNLSELIASKTINCPYKGFYTVSFNMNTDTLFSDFYIKAEYQTPSGFNSPIPIEIYEPYHTSGIVLSSNSSYVSPDGNNWSVTGQGSSFNFDACIKMYTIEAPIAKINYSVDELCQDDIATFIDQTPMPKDSIKWFVNDDYQHSAPTLDVTFNEPGTQLVKLAAFFGGSSDTAIVEIQVNPKPEKPTITQTGNTLYSSIAEYYQWYDIEGAIPGETLQYFEPPESATYMVEVSNEHLCSSMSDPYDFVMSIIYNTAKNEIIIYPNPTNGKIIIKNEELKINKITITDITGKIIYLKTCNHMPQQTEIDLKDKSKGIYFIEIKTNKKTYKEKIILNNI